MSLFFLSFCLLNLLWGWCLNLKNEHCVRVRFDISDNVVDVIDYLSKHWMSCIIHFSDINNSRFKNCHSSFIDSINYLNFSIDFCEIENIVPMNLKSTLWKIQWFLLWSFDEIKISSKPLSYSVFLLIIYNLFLIVLIIICTIIKNFFKFYSFSNTLFK